MHEKLLKLQSDAEAMRAVKDWDVRPLPLAKGLDALGVNEPVDRAAEPYGEGLRSKRSISYRN